MTTHIERFGNELFNVSNIDRGLVWKRKQEGMSVMSKPKHETYKVTMPNGAVEKFEFQPEATTFQHAQWIASAIIERDGGSVFGCKVQRVKDTSK